MQKKFFLLFLVFSFFFSFQKTFSQVGIRISPLRFEETVEPGEILTKYFKVTNTSKEPQTFYFFSADFKPAGEAGQAILIPSGSEEGPYLSSWVKIPKEGIEFKPGEEKQIAVEFHVPQSIGPGGYYGAIIVGPKPPKLEAQKGALVVTANQAALLVLFRVKGATIEEARVREFTTDKNFYNAPFSVKFITRIENFGNVHIKPLGVIEIKNLFGKTVKTLTLNEHGANVLPKTVRRFENTWADNFALGKYTAFLTANYGLSLAEGGQGIKSLSAQTSFWILPLKVVIPALLVFLILVFLLIIFVRAYKHYAVKRALEEAGLLKVRYVKKYEGPSPFVYLFIIGFIVLILIFLIFGLFFLIFFR